MLLPEFVLYSSYFYLQCHSLHLPVHGKPVSLFLFYLLRSHFYQCIAPLCFLMLFCSSRGIDEKENSHFDIIPGFERAVYDKEIEEIP